MHMSRYEQVRQRERIRLHVEALRRLDAKRSKALERGDLRAITEIAEARQREDDRFARVMARG
jgi:hypothetical protein